LFLFLFPPSHLASHRERNVDAKRSTRAHIWPWRQVFPKLQKNASPFFLKKLQVRFFLKKLEVLYQTVKGVFSIFPKIKKI
jgi:hypothetical protein